MPHRNRVTPFGTIEAVAERGTLMGNRGILHDAHGELGPALWRHPHWVACALAFKDHHREVLQPGTWTELFFLDEAVSFAAGHRPCAFCRRADYRRFVAAWRRAQGLTEDASLGFSDIDRALHEARVVPRRREQRRWPAVLGDLPTGSFVSRSVRLGEAWLVADGKVLRWSHAGYDRSVTIDAKENVSVLTPAPTVAAFEAGYAPMLHPTAQGLLASVRGHVTSRTSRRRRPWRTGPRACAR
ncbi:MAG: hypothetical protein WD673_02380 [Alphaproteobacteria bacterium]